MTRGPFTHHMSDDGRTLVIEEFREDGIYTTTLDWLTPADAEANVERALKLYVERNIGDTLNEVGQTQRCIRLGPFFVTVLGGPPTWWMPRIRISRQYQRIMVGWLRRGFVLALRENKLIKVEGKLAR